MKVVAIAQARMGSTRFPGKVMQLLGPRPVLHWALIAIGKAVGIDQLVLATSVLEVDNPIESYCKNNGWDCFRGSEVDVLDRLYQCAKKYEADVVLRLTCDCPFLDPNIISEVIRLREATNASYASNIDPPTYPDGLDVECFTMAALEAAHREATGPVDRDCAPQWIVRNRDRFPTANLTCPLPDLAKERWVLDTVEDYRFCHELVNRGVYAGMAYTRILDILDQHPEIRKINEDGVRNERFYQGLASEILPSRSFGRSSKQLERSLETIPFGTQTFSKSHIQYPAGRSPLYCTHGDGGYLFDVDGNRYVDLVNAVLPVILGYRDPDVDLAIRRQLDNGISFSLGTPLEAELAELLRKHIPCAEMSKFGKSGTDVTTAAVRLARAYTGRDRILMSGYHGWADWSMARSASNSIWSQASQDRSKGIPNRVKQLSWRFQFGYKTDVEVLATDEVAAIIVEPDHNDSNYLDWLRKLCNERGILLIFDEVITGFRYSIGGAQGLFGVTPDLATFGKAMANGMPISALCGKREIMKMMEPPNNIFYSGTMFGETLSIAAAIATINKLDRTNAIPRIWERGAILRDYIKDKIGLYGLGRYISIDGLPPRTMLTFHTSGVVTSAQLKTAFMILMAQAGVLIINSNNLSFAHGPNELERITEAYDSTFAILKTMINKEQLATFVQDSLVTAQPLRA